MSLVLNNPMTLAEFLAWEDRQPLRHEFDGVRAAAMTGGTLAHAAIQANLAIAIGGRLRGGPCRFYGSDLKIRTGEDHIRYPDGFVACGPRENTSVLVSDPVVIFEVLSSLDGGNRPDRQGAGIPGHAFGAALCHAGAGSHRRHGLRTHR